MTAPVTTAPADTTPVAYDFALIFASLRASLIQQLLVIWYSLSSYTSATLDQFLGAVIPLILAAEQTSGSATESYLNTIFGRLGLPESFYEDESDFMGPSLRGVPLEKVYERPFKEVWKALSNGYSLEYAIDMGAMRLRQLAETDLQLSHTHASRSLLSGRDDVVGFRRIPTGDYTCALCLIASTQRYRKLDLMPIHPGCDCRVAPIIAGEDPGQILDQTLLEDIHTAVENMFGFSDRSARAIDYRKLLVVHEHGEYGPTLARAGDKFTIIKDLSQED